MKPPKNKYIFIDWNKTLSCSFFWEQLSNTDHKYHKYFNEITRIFTNNKKLVKAWMRGQYSAENISEIINKNTGINSDLIFKELKESCENMKYVSLKIPQLITTIREKGIKVGIATDNMDTFKRFTIPAMSLDLIFDDILISSEIGFLKNDLKNNELYFFKSFLKEKRVSYSDLILVDDSTDTNRIYKKAGLNVINVKNVNELENVLTKYATQHSFP